LARTDGFLWPAEASSASAACMLGNTGLYNAEGVFSSGD
jgi:hypothetical protein